MRPNRQCTGSTRFPREGMPCIFHHQSNIVITGKIDPDLDLRNIAGLIAYEVWPPSEHLPGREAKMLGGLHVRPCRNGTSLISVLPC
jgi:hypothetical protein